MKPIIFNPRLIPGLLAGNVTETRRVVKPQPSGLFDGFEGEAARFIEPDGWRTYRPRYQPGDRLWVKETWATQPGHDHIKPSAFAPGGVTIYYRADGDLETWRVDRWRSPLFMPRWASRISLVVSGVDIRRVQEITRVQALASGVESVAAYRALWDELNGKRGFSWATNPWTWCYRLALVEADDV